MRQVKYISVFLISIFICFISVQNIYASTNIPEDIQKYAEGTGLEEFKKLILEDPVGYGYADKDEVNNVTLGPGFEVHLFDASKFNNVSTSLIDVSKPTGQYEFIVMSNGSGKSFLTIERYEDSFRVVVAGGDASRLAKSLDIMTNTLSTNSDYTDPVLIKDGNIRYLVANLNGKEVNIPDVPAEKNALMGGMDNNQLWDSEKTISFLKQVQSHGGNPDADGTGGYPILESNASNGVNNYFLTAVTSLLVAAVFTFIVYLLFKKKPIKK